MKHKKIKSSKNKRKSSIEPKSDLQKTTTRLCYYMGQFIKDKWGEKVFKDLVDRKYITDDKLARAKAVIDLLSPRKTRRENK